ncbi:MAG: HYR domain-containing protein, partial [Saprospiraceae bacterium]|nr:HYR domain-containing protein [Saprospiraceae bacterium]
DPEIACPADITVSNDPGQCSAVVNYMSPSGMDNCPGAILVQTTGLGGGSSFPVGSTTETYQVTDAAGNTISCSFTVTVNDTQNPTIACPADFTVSNDAGQCSAVVLYEIPLGSDNCPGAATAQTGGLGSGSAFPIGATTNTFEVTDAAGNTASCSFTITVKDTQNPAIACPADIVTDNDVDQCSAVVN